MPHPVAGNPTPLSVDQLGALIGAAARELSWGLHGSAREVRHRRARAEAIPDPTLRADALYALDRKRPHADGVALFSILPRRRDPELLRLLVGYQMILDFLDDVSERHPTERNGRQLHMALVDAVDVERPMSDYYLHHPMRDDGGYLAEIVKTCRSVARSLPSYDSVRELVVREALRSQVLALNHLHGPADRDAALRAWAADEYPDERELTWFELSATASATVVVLALLALASEPNVSEREVEATYAAYWPWVSLAGVMLDSYADEAEDAADGHHSYIAHYGQSDVGIQRLEACVSRATGGVLALRRGHRHAVIVACMAALYLSKDSVRTPSALPTTRRLAASGGSLTRLLVPILRAWRIAYSQQAS